MLHPHPDVQQVRYTIQKPSIFSIQWYMSCGVVAQPIHARLPNTTYTGQAVKVCAGVQDDEILAATRAPGDIVVYDPAGPVAHEMPIFSRDSIAAFLAVLSSFLELLSSASVRAHRSASVVSHTQCFISPGPRTQPTRRRAGLQLLPIQLRAKHVAAQPRPPRLLLPLACQ